MKNILYASSSSPEEGIPKLVGAAVDIPKGLLRPVAVAAGFEPKGLDPKVG